MQLLIRKFLPGEPLPLLFDCGKTDLNEFLLETGTATPNATLYEKEHLSRTYIVEDSDTDRVLGYFSLACDKIERTVSDPKIWNRLSRKVPNAKRRSSYPAIKIGRLAISREMQNSGLGGSILNFIKGTFFSNSRAGCRFLTVDAYLDAEDFYTKCKFARLVVPEPGDETVLMYFDLKSIDRI